MIGWSFNIILEENIVNLVKIQYIMFLRKPSSEIVIKVQNYWKLMYLNFRYRRKHEKESKTNEQPNRF